MTAVRIAHVEPRPGRQPDGGFRVHSFLVVLADDPGGRALPVWLTGPQGHGLWQIFAPGAGPPVHEAEAQTARLHLLGGMPTGPVSLPNSVTVPLAGTTDWTASEVSARVAEHGGMVQFGVFLRGPGRVALRNPRLSFTPAAGA